MSLTQSQTITLRMVQGGSATRNSKNKTAQSLKKMGLVAFSVPFGWHCTPEGTKKLKEILDE